MKLTFKATVIKTLVGLFALLLIAVVILIDPRFFLRSSYLATPQDKLQATAHPAWKAGMTPEAMCDVVDGGDSREYRGRLLMGYAHWDELFTRGSFMTNTLICSFPDEHSTGYQRWDLVVKRGTYDPEVVWHGFRQRGDVDVP